MESDSVADLCTVKVEDDPLCQVQIKTEPEVSMHFNFDIVLIMYILIDWYATC